MRQFIESICIVFILKFFNRSCTILMVSYLEDWKKKQRIVLKYRGSVITDITLFEKEQFDLLNAKYPDEKYEFHIDPQN